MTGRSINDRRILRLVNAVVGLGLLVRFALVDPQALSPLWLIVILALTGFGDLALSFMGRRNDEHRGDSGSPDAAAKDRRVARPDDDTPPSATRLRVAVRRDLRGVLA